MQHQHPVTPPGAIVAGSYQIRGTRTLRRTNRKPQQVVVTRHPTIVPRRRTGAGSVAAMRKFWQRPQQITSHDLVTTTIRTWKTEDLQSMSWSEPLEWLTRDLQHEAGLTDEARPIVRQRLLDLLLDRAVGGRTGVEAPASGAEPSSETRTVVLAGTDPIAIATLARHYGATAANDPMMTEFCGLEWELDFHLPHFAEWQATDPLAAQYSSAAQRNGFASNNATVANLATHLWAAFGHLEHLTQIRAAAPRAVIVVLHGGDDSAAANEACRRRAQFCANVERNKVERYWAFRLAAIRDTSNAQLMGFRTAMDPRLIEVNASEALDNPTALAADIAARLVAA